MRLTSPVLHFSLTSRDKVYEMRIRGSGFLYHQVRCMAAVLFLVGQGHEPPSTVSDLLNLSIYPRKPAYLIAPEYPLVLYDCAFENVTFLNSAGPSLHFLRSRPSFDVN